MEWIKRYQIPFRGLILLHHITELEENQREKKSVTCHYEISKTKTAFEKYYEIDLYFLCI